jgi:hypothetical protein
MPDQPYSVLANKPWQYGAFMNQHTHLLTLVYLQSSIWFSREVSACKVSFDQANGHGQACQVWIASS